MTRLPSGSALGPARTSFVGRKDEIRAIAARFRAGDRLVTVLGAPGAGKTRLAERFAATAWKGERVACSLAGARGSGDVVRALAGAMGVPLAGETAAEDVERLGFALAERGRCLVVLDAMEGAVEHAAATVGQWLDRAPEARWLCTSRHRLSLAGEWCLPLGGLAPEDARELFGARARFAPGAAPGEAAALDDLLDRLDRLPLAIELAAARAGVLSLPQLRGALSRRFELLTARSADAPARHLSMRAAIDVSWELLSPAEQRALSRASVFAGPFPLGAAAEVLDVTEPAALAALEALCDRSLVQVIAPEDAEDEARFGLYESLREYAAERLGEMDGGREQAAAEAAHARRYAEEGARHAAALDSPRSAAAVRALARDLDELLAAHRRARGSAPAVAAEAALSAGALLQLRGPFEAGRALFDSAVELAAALGDRGLCARSLFARGRALGMRGLHVEARRDFEASRAAARVAADRAAEARAVYGMSVTFRESGEDPVAARALAEEGLALARAAGDAEVTAWCLGSAATAAMYHGDLEASAAMHEEAVALLRRGGHVRAVAVNLGNLASVRELQGLVEEARLHFLECVALAEEAGDDVLRGKVLWGLSRLSFDAGRAAEAEAQLADLQASACRTGDREVAARVLVERARRALVGGDREAGLAWILEARAAAASLQAPIVLREIEAVRALAGPAGPALRADAAGYWFERAGVGKVDLARRRSLRLVLARLLEARLRGEPALSAEALLASGWPGESVHPEAGAMRVWTAVRTLRRLGLAGVLINRDGGYALDPAVPLELG